MTIRDRLFLLIHIFLLIFGIKGFPDDIPRCHSGDTQCVTKTSMDLIKKYSKLGYPELGFPILEPFSLKKFEITDGRPGANLNLKLNFRDMLVSGLSTANIERSVGFTSDPLTSKYEMYCRFTKLNLRGQYTASGRILILPIQGDGNANINIINPKASVKFKPKVHQRNGKSYLDVDRLKILLEPEKVEIHLGNLFNGDRALGDNVNNFINENWRDVWTELQPSIHAAIAEVLKNVMKEIFTKFSYEEIFLED